MVRKIFFFFKFAREGATGPAYPKTARATQKIFLVKIPKINSRKSPKITAINFKRFPSYREKSRRGGGGGGGLAPGAPPPPPGLDRVKESFDLRKSHCLKSSRTGDNYTVIPGDGFIKVQNILTCTVSLR